jgi:DNA-binding NtrC family response regulator
MKLHPANNSSSGSSTHQNGNGQGSLDVKVLVVSSDPERSQMLATILQECGLPTVLCSSLNGARTLLGSGSIPFVFCEDTLADGSFQDLLQSIADSGTRIPLVTFSRAYEWNRHLEAVRSGAFAYLAAPFRSREIRPIVRAALLEHAPSRKES